MCKKASQHKLREVFFLVVRSIRFDWSGYTNRQNIFARPFARLKYAHTILRTALPSYNWPKQFC